MAWASKTYTFSPSTTIRSGEVNQNFDDCVNGLNTAMPSGGIILWSGAIVDIPTGWYLCNGSNGTPDLRDRFVVGAGGAYAVGNTGGAASINIAHTHTIAHTHPIPHTHTIPDHSLADDTPGGAYTTIPNKIHGTSSQPSIANSSASSATDSGSALSSTQSILPPYYALAYIMKS